MASLQALTPFLLYPITILSFKIPPFGKKKTPTYALVTFLPFLLPFSIETLGICETHIF